MARGGKRGHKGGRKQYTNPQQLDAAKEKEKREKAWRRERGEDTGSDDEEESGSGSGSGSDSDTGTGTKVATGATAKKGGAAAAKAESFEEESSSEEEESSSDDEGPKRKGAEGLIEIENPNRAKKQQKKVTAITESSKPQLSRREREEIEKQRAKAHYQKMHAAGKTEEARADLARLAIIRKQREEATKKREAEAKAREEAAKAKADAKKK